MADWTLLLSCEHGGNLVPEPYRPLFSGAAELLASHRGYDPGVAPFARWLAVELQVPLEIAAVSRLLVELNRSLHHPALFSRFSRDLDREQKQQILQRYYHPYRNAFTRRVEQALRSGGRVCHLALHSFTPELDGVVRNADIGLLYDPRRPLELAFCRNWQTQITALDGSFRVRRNYPYRGAADCFVTHLRRRFPAERYLGLELELNQRWPLQGGARWQALQELVRDSLRRALQND